MVASQLKEHCEELHGGGFLCQRRGCMIRCKTLGEAGLHYYYLHEQRYRGNELLHSFTELNVPWTAIPYSWVSFDMLSFLALDCRLVALSFGAAWH